VPQAVPAVAAAAQEMQQQIQYLHNQLAAQQQMFLQQQQYLLYQQQHMAAQNQGPRAEPSKVKLQQLWTSQARSWFQLAESQLGIFSVNDLRMRFNIVVSSLSDKARLHAKAVVESPQLFRDLYLALRERLIEVYQPSAWQMAAEFLRLKELGDRRPPDLLDEMLALLPADLTVLVKATFLGNLPADLRDHVQEGAELLSYQQLAARADTMTPSGRAGKPTDQRLSLG